MIIIWLESLKKDIEDGGNVISHTNQFGIFTEQIWFLEILKIFKLIRIKNILNFI